METSSTSLLEKNRILIKGIFIGIMILIMLIPGAFITSLVQERAARQDEVVKEVSSKWAGDQTINGPVLTVPYKTVEHTAEGKDVVYTHRLYLLPETLQINGELQPESRHRSLFDITVYHSTVSLKGSFNFAPLYAMQIPAENIQWADARIAITVADIKGLDEEIGLSWIGVQQKMKKDVGDDKFLKEGSSAVVPVRDISTANFNININLKGSGLLYFTPVGNTTEVTLKAPWKSPAFDGQYLPVKSSIGPSGFEVTWRVLSLSRAYPQCWKDYSPAFETSTFGVRLLQPVDGYARTLRCVKYAILFIALTFVFFFFLEILQKRQIHPLQYIIVAMALTIFYTLLLSISEYTGFNIAYMIATIATVTLIGLYVGSIFNNKRTAFAFTAILLGLYSYIFVLVQSEDYALLLGSIGLFIIIAIIMYYSRKIDWYGHHSHKQISDAQEKDHTAQQTTQL